MAGVSCKNRGKNTVCARTKIGKPDVTVKKNKGGTGSTATVLVSMIVKVLLEALALGPVARLMIHILYAMLNARSF